MPRRFDAVSGQSFRNAARSFPGEELGINPFYDLCLFLVDNKLPVGSLVIAEKIGVSEAYFSVREGLSATPRGIFTNGSALFLRNNYGDDTNILFHCG